MRRLPLTSLQAGTRALPPHSAHYLVKVLRAREGDPIEVFDPHTGATAAARVITTGTSVMIAIETVRAEPAAPPLVLIQGYPKGDKLSDIVRDATELGATLIVPAICERSVARPDAAKADARAERLATVAAEAARQCGRARAPEIAPPMALADALALAREHTTNRFVLWERATTPIELLSLDRADGAAFAIGPEGGLTDAEVAMAEALGFTARSLGPTILRTETAATAILGAYTITTRAST
jgi:16S rRNA (uracil1498-N3)-methyltransferase